MNTRSRGLLGTAVLACLTLAALPGGANAADELGGVVVKPPPAQAGGAIPVGNRLVLPAPRVQQAAPATQATQATQATAVKVPARQAPAIQIAAPAPTLGNTQAVAVGNNKSDLKTGPIQLASPGDRGDVRLAIPDPKAPQLNNGTAGSGSPNAGMSNTSVNAGVGGTSGSPGMAGSTPSVTGQQPMAGTGHPRPGASAGGTAQPHGHVEGRYCPHCAGQAAQVKSDTERALATQRGAEAQASRLLGEPARGRVHTYAITRSGADELAAQSAAIDRMRGGAPVQGLSVRDWEAWQFKNGTGNGASTPPARPAQPGWPAKLAEPSGAAATACEPPPPVTPNPEFQELQNQREELLKQARALAASDPRSPELAQLERDIQALEAKLRWTDAFLDPCNRETTRTQNEAARADLRLPPERSISLESEGMLRRIDEFATSTRTRLAQQQREPGQSYYEDWVEGKRDWHSLPDREKQEWAEEERRLLRDQDERSLRDWRARADAEEARARDAAQAARQAAFNARVEAEQARMREADAAAAERRKAEQQRARARAKREALDAEARALNEELRSAIASGDKARQREIEARLDQITEYMTTQYLPDSQEQAAISRADAQRMAQMDAQRAAAKKQAAADAQRARIDRGRSLAQQNRNVLTRSSAMVGGFGIAAGKAAAETVQMGIDGVSTGMRAAGGDPAPNRSAIGKLWDDSKTLGEFGSRLWEGLVGMAFGAKDHLVEGDAKGFGEDLFNFGSMAAPMTGPKKPPAAAAAGDAARSTAAAPGAAARIAEVIDIGAFRALTPEQQARALAGKSEAVRTGVLQKLTKKEQDAFVQADGARAIREAPHGLYDSPDGVWTFLTDLGERVIVGDDLRGLSMFEDIVPLGTYTRGMSAAEIQALLAKGPPYTSAELLAKLELVYDGRAPRLVMDADTARAMYEVMLQHFRQTNYRMPTPDELAPLLRALDGRPRPAAAAPAVTAGTEAPFGYGPTGTLAARPLPKGGVPHWLAAKGADAQALPSQLRQAPVERPPAIDPNISSMGTVQK